MFLGKTFYSHSAPLHVFVFLTRVVSGSARGRQRTPEPHTTEQKPLAPRVLHAGNTTSFFMLHNQPEPLAGYSDLLD